MSDHEEGARTSSGGGGRADGAGSAPSTPHGILKQGGEGSRKAGAVRWDEENLKYNEENKSATMKIDEPKTPYNFSPPESGMLLLLSLLLLPLLSTLLCYRALRYAAFTMY